MSNSRKIIEGLQDAVKHARGEGIAVESPAPPRRHRLPDTGDETAEGKAMAQRSAEAFRRAISGS